MKKEKILKNCEKLLEKGFSPLLRIKNYNNKSFEERKYTEKNYIRKIENYRHENDVTGFSIITGSVSHIMVLDLDRHKGKENGIELFKELIKDFSQEDKEVIRNTFTVKTPHNGLHLYFKYKEGLKTKADIYPSIDLRTDGGLICAPFSVRENNKVYEPIDFDRQVLEMPQALYDLLYHKTFENRNNSTIPDRKVDIKYTQIKRAKNIKIKRNYKINYKILGEIIKNNVSVIDILQEYYGINARNVRGNIPCPVHGGKNNNFAIYEDTNTCYCFSKCSSAYNPISLVMERTRLDYKETLLEVANRFNIDESDYMEPIEVFKPDDSKTIELKYENYVSEKIEDIKEIIRTNNKILLDSPTGSGKTFAIVEIMKNFTNDLNILLTPNVIQNKQNSSKYGIQAFTGNDKFITSNCISATFDKAKSLIAYIKDNKLKVNLFIDECHLLVDASNYRMRAIKKIIELSKLADKVIYMSATNNYIRDVIEYDKEIITRPKKSKNNIEKAKILYLDESNDEGSLVNKIINTSNEKDRKTILFYDNKKRLDKIKSLLLKSGINEKEIAIIKSNDRDDNGDNVFDNIVNFEEIPKETRIILTTSVLEVGTNIQNNGVDIFIYIPQSSHLNFNKIVQEVARFRNTGSSDNTLNICLTKREKEQEFKSFKYIKEKLVSDSDKIVKALIMLLELCEEESKEEKIDLIKNNLARPRSFFNVRENFSLGFIGIDKENAIPVVNKYKLQRRAKEIYERQFFYDLQILEDKLKTILNVNMWEDPLYIKDDSFKEDIKEINKANKELKKKGKERIIEIFKEIKELELEELFIQKVDIPECTDFPNIIENNYIELLETGIIQLTKQALDLKISPSNIVNSFIENGNSKDKNIKYFNRLDYIKFNKKYPINSINTINELKQKEYVICRKVFDEVCRKQGKLTKSKKLALLIELLENKVLQGYIIKNGTVYKQSKKKGSDTTLKPLISKDIDKLTMPLISSIYKLKFNDIEISSLKKI